MPSSTSTAPANAAHILRDAFRTYGEHFSVVIGASAVLQMLQLVLSLMLMNRFGEVVGLIWTGVLSLVIAGITTGVYTLLVLHLRVAQERLTVVELLGRSLRWALPLTGLAVVTGIGQAIGLAFFLIPGFFLMILWAVAPPALICERSGVFGSMRSSWNLTKTAVGAVVVITIFEGAVGIGIPQLAGMMGEDMAMEDLFIAQAVVTAAIAPIAAIALAELYLQLAGFRPGTEVSFFDPVTGERHGAAAPAPGPYVPVPQQPQAPAAPVAHAPAYPDQPCVPIPQTTPIPTQPQPAPYAQPASPEPLWATAPPPTMPPAAPPTPEAPARSASVPPPGLS